MIKPKHRRTRKDDFAAKVERALLRAARVARKEAKMHGTRLWFWENGKVIAKRP